MTELEKIEYAKTFIDKLASGINPLDDTPIPDDDIANNVRLSRCFFYVSDVLRQVIENGGVSAPKAKKQKKKAFSLTDEERLKLKASDYPLTVSEISDCLNSLVNTETTKKISATAINDWLLSLGVLELTALSNGKQRKLPTPQGNEIGIYTEERSGQYGPYTTVLFSSSAQQFIYDNIEALISLKSENEMTPSEFYGRPWSAEQDDKLSELCKNNTSVAEMAYILQRSVGGIRARLKKLGLIDG